MEHIFLGFEGTLSQVYFRPPPLVVGVVMFTYPGILANQGSKSSFLPDQATTKGSKSSFLPDQARGQRNDLRNAITQAAYPILKRVVTLEMLARVSHQ